MKIIISGGTGMIGRRLTKALLEAGYDVFVLTRKPITLPKPTTARYVNWEGVHSDSWKDELEGALAVVNFAGENIGNGRWTVERKYQIENSRIDAGKVLSDTIRKLEKRPGLFIQASAIGYYGTSLSETYTEESSSGSDYLASVAKKWEDSSIVLDQIGVPRTIIRTGVVLDSKDGALSRMLLPFKFFIGGPIGTGQQWLSWIHLDDEVGAIKHIIQNNLTGVFNLTAPYPVTNAELGKALARTLKRPYWIPVPEFAMRLLFGEMSTLILDGQKVSSYKLIESGYKFKHPEIAEALQHTLSQYLDT